MKNKVDLVADLILVDHALKLPSKNQEFKDLAEFLVYKKFKTNNALAEFLGVAPGFISEVKSGKKHVPLFLYKALIKEALKHL